MAPPFRSSSSLSSKMGGACPWRWLKYELRGREQTWSRIPLLPRNCCYRCQLLQTDRKAFLTFHTATVCLHQSCVQSWRTTIDHLILEKLFTDCKIMAVKYDFSFFLMGCWICPISVSLLTHFSNISMWKPVAVSCFQFGPIVPCRILRSWLRRDQWLVQVWLNYSHMQPHKLFNPPC